MAVANDSAAACEVIRPLVADLNRGLETALSLFQGAAVADRQVE